MFFSCALSNVQFFFGNFPDIEAQILEIQKKKKEIAQTSSDKGVGLLESGSYFDSEFYDDGANNKNRYETSIAANDADDADEEEDEGMPMPQTRATYTAPKAVLKDIVQVSWFPFVSFWANWLIGARMNLWLARVLSCH